MATLATDQKVQAACKELSALIARYGDQLGDPAWSTCAGLAHQIASQAQNRSAACATSLCDQMVVVFGLTLAE